MMKKFIGILILVVFLGGVGWFFLRKQDVPPGKAPIEDYSPSPVPSPLASPHSPVSKAPVKSSPRAQKAVAQTWEEFSEKFGTGLKPEFLKNGRLVTIRGGAGMGKPADRGFRPEDPQKSIARAREILSAAEGLLGLRSDWPLENASTRGSSVSAQVFFSETYQGIVIQPVGNIKIDLGPEGELVGLYSDYAADLSVTNEVRLNLEEAQKKAVEAVQKPGSKDIPGIQKGTPIIWATSDKEGRHAYQFIVKGHQVVIDAQTGKVLFSRDRRQF